MWELLFFSGLTVLYGTGIAWSLVRLKRKRLQTWQDAARSCGLQVEEVSGASAGWLKARAGPLAVRIEDSRTNDYGCRIVVTAPGPPGFPGVRIRRESQRFGAHEIEIGDEPFDQAFYIVGPMRLLFALLDAATRHLLISVNAESRLLEIVDGELRSGTFDSRVADLLPLLLEIGRRFAEPLDVAQRLAENARRDPDAEVRLRNLRLLVRELPGDPGAVAALRTAGADPSPQVRLWAAKELGAEGRGVLVELAESTSDDAVSAQAVSILDRELPFDRATTLLNVALRRRRMLTARACLEVLGRNGGAAAIPLLEKVLAREHGELAAAAAQALGSTGSPAVEAPLLLALSQALEQEQTDIQVAAANALARAGTVAAVLPLKEAAERSSHHPEVRKATRQAIAEIQSRRQGASPGQLSLAGAEAGQLSLAPTAAGQLSLATDPAGELSLPAAEPGQLSLGGGEPRGPRGE